MSALKVNVRRGGAALATFVLAMGISVSLASSAEAGVALWYSGGCVTEGVSVSTGASSGPYSGSCGYGYGVTGYSGSSVACSHGGQNSAICSGSNITRGYHTTPAGSGSTYV